MIGWALRWLLVACGVTLACVALFGSVSRRQRSREARPVSVIRAVNPSEPRSAPAFDTLVFPANPAGHVMIDAVVNGAPMRMLVDTGASLVTLTPADARAAGIDPAALVFDRSAGTAGGVVPMAPVTLRRIRIGQLAIDDVPAAVIAHLDISLLGMSFLDRLRSYEMRGGELTITW